MPRKEYTVFLSLKNMSCVVSQKTVEATTYFDYSHMITVHSNYSQKLFALKCHKRSTQFLRVRWLGFFFKAILTRGNSPALNCLHIIIFLKLFALKCHKENKNITSVRFWKNVIKKSFVFY